ncbi:MAG TPA: sulfite exporter TauE/SafE family protein [Candidatus Bathyarchaeia archaeon]|nr:sulfite exporter TauE/SafE family protein [Candidatus Bathyarchaeia archaeon]
MIDMIIVLLITLAAGFLGALTGLGGGSIMVPVLVALDVPVKYAIAASMITIIATSSGSAASYVRERITNVRAAFYLEMFTITGAIIGATITSFIAPRYLYFFFAAFLLSSFLGISGHLKEDFPKKAKQDRLSRWLGLEGSYFDQAENREVKYKMTNAGLGGLGMFVAGLAAGMLGIGAGAFKVSVHELILKMPSKVSSTTSNFIIGITALAGASVYFASGLIFIGLAAPMAVGTTIGALLGGRILNRFRNRYIRYLFLLIVLILIIQMLYKGVTLQ